MKNRIKTLVSTLITLSIILTFISCIAILISYKEPEDYKYSIATPQIIDNSILNLRFEEDEDSYAVRILDTTKKSTINIPSIYNNKSVTKIPNGGFRYSKTNKIYIPNSITQIGYMAFWNCENITEITLPRYLRSDCSNWFYYCTNLENIYVDSLNSALSSVDGVLFNKDQSYIYIYPQGRTKSSYTIPETVTIIANGCFYNASSLTSINIPNFVVSIGSDAFKETSITEIKLHKTVKILGSTIFPKTLMYLYYEGTQEEWENIYNNGDVYCRYYDRTTYKFYRLVPDITYNYNFD